MTGTHRAAILSSKGAPLSINSRPTPSPGPNEILIQVKAIALNPVDYYQRDTGVPPPTYPAILGSDISGLVTKVGSQITNPPLPVGSRVLAFASSFYQNGSADHGAFQEFVLAQSEGVIPLPDNLSFEQGAVFPLAVLTALSAWTTCGIPLDTRFSREDRQAVLIWGGASSVRTLAVQSAKSLGFRVYTTSNPQHHDYLKKLGADEVFDYKASDVVSQIISSAERDGVVLRTAHCVVQGSLGPTLDVLKETKGEAVAKVAYSPGLVPESPSLEGVEVKFNLPPMDPMERNEHMFRCFHGWLRNGLEEGTVVPSPHVKVEEGGLEGLNRALDVLKEGVSGTKIVVPL